HPWPGWPLAVAASVVLLVVQQIDNHVISPRVVTRTVRLHPLTVMLSLLAAGAVLGLWGMLLVIPVVAAAKILVIHYWDTRMVWPPRGAPPSPAADGVGWTFSIPWAASPIAATPLATTKKAPTSPAIVRSERESPTAAACSSVSPRRSRCTRTALDLLTPFGTRW